MTALNQDILDVLINCLIKTVLTGLFYVFGFISVAQFFPGLTRATVGDICDVDVEKCRTDGKYFFRVDGTQRVSEQWDAERKIFSPAFTGRLRWLRTQRSYK